MNERLKSKEHDHKIMLEKPWLVLRKELLKKEKAFTRQRDEVSRLRRQLKHTGTEDFGNGVLAK